MRIVSMAVVLVVVGAGGALAQTNRAESAAKLLQADALLPATGATTATSPMTDADVRLALRAMGVDDELLTSQFVTAVRQQLGPRAVTATAVPLGRRLAKSLGSFTVRRSFLDQTGIDRAAALSFSTYHASDATVAEGADRTQMEVRTAVVWTPARLTLGQHSAASVSPLLGIDVDVTSGLKKDADRITGRAGIRASFSPVTSTFAHTVIVAYDRATDRDFEADVRGVTLQYSLIKTSKDGVDWISLGGATKLKWRPSVGYTFLDVRDTAGSIPLAELKDTNQWYGLLEAELALGSLTFKPALMAGQRRGAAVRSYALGELITAIAFTGKDAPLKAELTFELSAGHRFPKFLNERRAKIALAVKF